MPAGRSEPIERSHRNRAEGPIRRTPTGAVLAACLALVAAVFAQDPGRLAADTKLDLVVNPVGFLGRALHLWDPSAGFGGIQNQAQGYLVPTGPFFAVGKALHVPMWCVQRAWMGLLLAVALTGVVRLADQMGLGRPLTRLAGGLAYALSPDLVSLVGPISANVLAPALLPWVLLPLVAGGRTGSPRRAAARSGIAVALMGAANAASTLAVLPLPALWLATRARGPRRRRLVGWWLVSLALACAWWLLPLAIEGHYSFNFLPYIERAATTTATASPAQVLRGVSHWVAFYSFQGQPWWQGAWLLVSAPAAILASAVLAAAGLAGLAHTRLSQRRFLILAVLVGLAAVAGGYEGPLAGPLGPVVRHLLDGPLVIFRNVHKFEPLVALPLALGLVHGLAVVRWRRREQQVLIVVVVLLLAGTALPLLSNQLLAKGTFTAVPAYWSQAARWLAGHAHGERSLLLPASGFPDYSWGRPTDEPLQPLAGSPWAVLDQVPLGSTGEARLLDAVENRLVARQPSAGLAPFLARAGVGYLVVRNDLDFGRAGAPGPSQIRSVLEASPGIRRVTSFGPVVSPLLGSVKIEPGAPSPPAHFRAVDVYQVAGAASPAAVYPANRATIVSGGPGSLLQVADRGQLGGAMVEAGDPTAGLGPQLRWAVTDGLRRRNDNFGLVQGGYSYVLTASEPAPGGGQPEDRLPVPGVAHQTVATMEGAASVEASSYATAVGPHPENQPMAAFDGDPATAWETGAPVSSDGQWVQLDLDQAQSFPFVDVSLLAPLGGPHATQLGLTTDTGTVTDEVADTEAPQALALPPGPTRHLRVTLLGVAGEGGSGSLARAGLREVNLPGLTVTRVLSVPSDQAGHFAAPGAPPPLYAFNRATADPLQSLRTDEEDRLDRHIVVPHDASFSLSGLARPRLGAPISLSCGQGPAVTLDGIPVPTEVTTGASVSGELAFSGCGPAIHLSAGAHQLETDPGDPLAVDSAALTGVGWPPTPAGPPRHLAVGSWGSVRRTLSLGPGPAAVVATTENFNRGWSASLDGRSLPAIRLDGWRQAWAVPAGKGGQVTLEFVPDHAYRAALMLGGVGLIGLVGLSLRRRRRGTAYLAPLSEGHRPVAVAALAGASLLIVGGPLMLAVPILISLMGASMTGVAEAAALVAGAAFFLDGVVQAINPAQLPASHAGAFGPLGQLGALVAAGALAAGLVAARSPGVDLGTWLASARRAGGGQEDGSHAGPAGQEPVQPPGARGDVMVGGSRQLDVDEAVGAQQTGQGPAGEQAEVADDLVAGPAEHAELAHLGEDGLDPTQEEEAIEPGGQVGGGQQQGPSRDQDPSGLGQGQVGIDQVLDDLAHQHHVERRSGEGQAGVVDAGPHHDEPPGP